MHHVTVRSRLASPVVTLNDTLETLTLGGTDHVHPLTFFEKIKAGMLNFRKLIVIFETKLEDFLLRFTSVGLHMALLGLGETRFLLLVIANLDSGVSVFLSSLLLEKNIVADVDHSDRHSFTVLVEDASHANFFTNQSDAHCTRPCLKFPGLLFPTRF